MTGDVARLFTDVSSLRPCYQARYHFLEKAAQNRMNQGPTNRSMSLKYKEQHESRRNVNQTHNPKVVGSNPTPATKSPSQPLAFGRQAIPDGWIRGSVRGK